MGNGPTQRDYNLTDWDSEALAANGLAAEWYETDIPRKRMKQLMQRSDGPAIRDTIIWLAMFVSFFGTGGYWLPAEIFGEFGNRRRSSIRGSEESAASGVGSTL